MQAIFGPKPVHDSVYCIRMSAYTNVRLYDCPPHRFLIVMLNVVMLNVLLLNVVASVSVCIGKNVIDIVARLDHCV